MARRDHNQSSSTPRAKVVPQTRVGVLGGGAGGTATALELARRGFLVDLFDKNGDILLGSSNATPGRAGHGFHYVHPETGILYLDATLEILKEFPGSLLGASKREDHFLRHGLYFIMKEAKDLDDKDKQFASLFPAQQILATYEQLKLAYQQKVEQDKELRFFGDSDQFYIIRDLSDFSDIVDTSKTAAAVDTREELLNWPLVRAKLCQQVNIHPNITVHTRALVRRTHYDADTHGFVVETNQGEFRVNYVVNATWENVEYLSHSMGFYVQPEDRTMRLKGIVKVILPDSLKDKSSMFFCMGAHCMFSNMGDGTGMITYAPITNIHSSTKLRVNTEMQSFLNGEATQEKKMKFAREILEGVSHYIPAMHEATIVDVGFGIIKTMGEVDIFDPGSRFHHRDYLGVTPQQIGWIDNSCMKLLYFIRNARLTASTLEQHVVANGHILQIKDRLYHDRKPVGRKDMAEMVVVNLQRYYDSDAILEDHEGIARVMASVIANKVRLHREFKQVTWHKTRGGAAYHGLLQVFQLCREVPLSGKTMVLIVAAVAILVVFKFCSGCDIIYPNVSFWAPEARSGDSNDSSGFCAEQSSPYLHHVYMEL